MAPKFRGNSDDWLDEEDKSRRSLNSTQKKKGNAPKASALPWEQANATVAEVFPKQCRVRMDDGRDVSCQYRRAAVLGHAGAEYRERSPVAVGDRVQVTMAGDTGVIDGVCARKNRLVRHAPARDEKIIHVLAANVDVLMIVAAASDPAFSPGLVDRFLVAASIEGITPILCINKRDLWQGVGAAPWQVYRDIGVEVFEVSAKKREGVEALKNRLRDLTVVFSGHSGVGKTSLLSALLDENVGAVGEVSQVTGKGRHTTTSAVLLDGPGKSRWIDTPGVRAFGLFGVEPETLGQFFAEFSGLPCAQAGCLHSDEVGCDAKGLPRYESYHRILTSILSGEH